MGFLVISDDQMSDIRPATPESSKREHGVTTSYDNFVRAVAKKFTNSPDEAREAMEQMFEDIARTRDGRPPSTLERLTARIAMLRLLKFLRGRAPD